MSQPNHQDIIDALTQMQAQLTQIQGQLVFQSNVLDILLSRTATIEGDTSTLFCQVSVLLALAHSENPIVVENIITCVQNQLGCSLTNPPICSP